MGLNAGLVKICVRGASECINLTAAKNQFKDGDTGKQVRKLLNAGASAFTFLFLALLVAVVAIGAAAASAFDANRHQLATKLAAAVAAVAWGLALFALILYAGVLGGAPSNSSYGPGFYAIVNVIALSWLPIVLLVLEMLRIGPIANKVVWRGEVMFPSFAHGPGGPSLPPGSYTVRPKTAVHQRGLLHNSPAAVTNSEHAGYTPPAPITAPAAASPAPAPAAISADEPVAVVPVPAHAAPIDFGVAPPPVIVPVMPAEASSPSPAVSPAEPETKPTSIDKSAAAPLL
ncbi:uncharacterized protein AMSG_07300 [Thecamonas trahens ATCC 50062]|uniref:PGG domain-containing protein n=1 Tax=Thecamonas trahens ATCC 50062 TaxID=461836 RepID=A0A0L0DG15_THETB|nr:hypothetical protein AMSG_07300 [Thecamonas trahens ATCC 50062]KNC51292.1 hypothetical protein AMSG_07300 [Thecamonas trahens ATCC 50062]|eukprot:XP_013756216.1 hypothetical protein AMSG_07300 [Thecamonas trahens ATCC 50062]